MPVCNAAEIGVVQGEAVVVGMPKRPAWRGVVSNAQQLQQLEEREFERWKQVRGACWVVMKGDILAVKGDILGADVGNSETAGGSSSARSRWEGMLVLMKRLVIVIKWVMGADEGVMTIMLLISV